VSEGGATLFDFAMTPRLETERLVLRAVDPDGDLEALFDLFADPEVARFTDTGPFTDPAEAVEVVEWIAGLFASRRGLRWAITERDRGDVMIGTCGFNRWHRWNNSAEIGYDLARRCWGRGVMTEAVRAMVRFGFERMALNRVEADVTVGNEASARVLDRLGFHEEGTLRQRGLWKGSYHDVRLFSLLRDDWRDARGVAD
jgi:[ribosomal protein S5]-alanine N-acetyltransferase